MFVLGIVCFVSLNHNEIDYWYKYKYIRIKVAFISKQVGKEISNIRSFSIYYFK